MQLFAIWKHILFTIEQQIFKKTYMHNFMKILPNFEFDGSNFPQKLQQ